MSPLLLVLVLALACSAAACSGKSPTSPSRSTPPKVSGIAPASGAPGTTVDVELTGAGFVVDSRMGLSVSGDDIGVSDFQVTSATTATARLTVAADAPLGARTLIVTTPGAGASAGVTFMVAPPAPTLKAIAPASAERDTTVEVTVTGTQFVADATTMAVSGSGVTVKNLRVASATSATADFVIAASAATGARHVTVTTAGGTSAVVMFTVTAPLPPIPTLASVSPSAGDRAAAVNVTLTGTSFVSGATTVAVSGGGVTVSGVTVVNATTLTAIFTIDGATTLGVRNVSVTTADGTSAAQTFTVNQPHGSMTFNYTGASQSFAVPAGVTSITVQAFGAQGGEGLSSGAAGGAAGLGGSITATLTVASGTHYQINVGGRGGDGALGVDGGGGGGGASDVRTGANTLGERVLVAGGGGGGGLGTALFGSGGAGGAGGGLVGAAGVNALPGADGGTGGTQSAGGNNGGGGGAVDGASGEGGAGGGIHSNTPGGFDGGGSGALGGGGGGGYYGGGGGGEFNSGAGGGGGSSFAIGTATGVIHTQGGHTGNGQVVITW